MASPFHQLLSFLAALGTQLSHLVFATRAETTSEITTAAGTPILRNHLLTLPPELRNTIYRLALLSDDQVQVDKRALIARKVLLETNAQIRKEALGIFYFETDFLPILDGLTVRQLAKWLSTLGTRTRLITGLEIGIELCDEALAKMRASSPAADLNEIRLHRKMFRQMLEHDGSKIQDALFEAWKSGLVEHAVSFTLDGCEPGYGNGQDANVAYRKAACTSLGAFRAGIHRARRRNETLALGR